MTDDDQDDGGEVDERYLRAEAAQAAIDDHCVAQRFFAYRLAVPGAQLTSTPFFCVGVVPSRDDEYVTFFFCLDPELNAFRVDPAVVEVARECVAVAVRAVAELGTLEHRIRYVHVGIPPVDPSSLPRPPEAPPLSTIPEVSPQEAAAIATAFFQDHVDLHQGFVEEIKAEVPRSTSIAPLDVERVLWLEAEETLVVNARLDDEELDPRDPPEVVRRIVESAVDRLRARHPETARFPVRVLYLR